MLKPVTIRKTSAKNGRFAIVASRYNAQYVDSMLNAATKTLKEGGAKEVKIVRVPGAFEIPAVVARLLKRIVDLEAVICLGVILRGQTSHAQQIGDAVSGSLAQLQVQHAIPVIHEVLLLENEEQAKARCLDAKRNRGTEAAQTALEMAEVMRGL